MNKEDMIDYITSKLPELDYSGVEMVYGLMLGITGQDFAQKEQ